MSDDTLFALVVVVIAVVVVVGILGLAVADEREEREERKREPIWMPRVDPEQPHVTVVKPMRSTGDW